MAACFRPSASWMRRHPTFYPLRRQAEAWLTDRKAIPQCRKK